MKKTLMLAALLVVSASLAAQTSDIASNKLNETLITTENFETSVLDTAKDVTIITQEDIQNKGATTVAEALKGVPGLKVMLMDGGQPVFDLRGFGASAAQNTLVLLDGVPINSIAGTGYDTSQIPISMIDRIEVIPGGGSVMYGDGAVGGVINIITQAPQDKENYGSVGTEVSSWSTLNGNLHYGTKIADRLLMDIAYNGYRSNDYRSKGMSKYDHADTKSTIWLRGRYLLDNGSVDVRYRHSNTEDFYTGALTREQFKDNPKQSNPTSNGVTKPTEDSYLIKYDTKVTDNLDFMMYGGYLERDQKGSSVSKWGPYEGHTVTKQYYVKPQGKYTYADNSYIILGGDFQNGKSENKKSNDKDQKRKSYAGYIMNKTTVGDFQFTQGFRHEKIDYDYNKNEYDPITSVSTSTPASKKFSNNSWELGVNYLYSDTGSVYVSYNHGFRGPTIQDLNSWSGNIKIQKNDTYELGIKDMYKNTYVSASVFRMDSNKEIFYDSIDPVNSTNKNFDGKIRRNGAQISLEHYFDKLTLRENVTYMQAKTRSGKYSGHRFPMVPRWTVNAGATYNFTDKLLVNLDMYYTGKEYTGNDFTNVLRKSDSVVTFDTNVRYQMNEGLELYAGIRNLFDKDYCNAIYSNSLYNSMNYYPAEGRSYYAGFRYNF